MRRALAIVLVLAAVAGCIRVIVNVGGRDVEHKQEVDVEQFTRKGESK